VDVETTSDVVLLPIKPEYAQAIQEGTKTVEFRKRKFARPVKYIVVYATSPMKKVLGFFEIESVVTETPDAIWRRFKEVGGITKPEYKTYYQDASLAVGICIGTFTSLSKPINLSQIKKGMKAPQSYCYLDSKSFNLVKKYAR